jgi:mono/diheme cytochrome c family protein
MAFVCNQFENRVEVIHLGEKRQVSNHPTIREPVASVLSPDGHTLFATNLLPAGAANTGNIASSLSVIDITNGKSREIPMPNGATDARALALSPDGHFVYVVHTLSRYGLPTTQVDRGWMNTSAVSVFDANQPRLIATVLLDEINLGAANPSGVTCSRDGRLLAITHAGTHELSLIDRNALHERIDRAGRGETVTAVSKSIADIPNDLSFLHGIRNRVKLNGNGPRSIVTTPDGFAVTCYFSETLHLVKTNSDLTCSVRDIVLTSDKKQSTERLGEQMFFDATRCFQNWQSCATCHPQIRTDALNWDLLNDGVGNPKQTKNMLFAIQTPPAMISGIRPNAETAIRTGMRYIQFIDHSEADALVIEAFFHSIRPVPSPALVNGELSPAALRGKKIFAKAECARCHNGTYFTDGHLHKVGTDDGVDTGKAWDTPSLREAWRTAPYLHDGRAATLDDMLKTFNPGDEHGETSTLSADQRHDLVEYIRSL